MPKKQERTPNELGLLPCACGCTDTFPGKTQEGAYFVMCGWCGHTCKEQDTKEKAMELWNARQKARHKHTAQWIGYKEKFECNYCHSLHDKQSPTCPVCKSQMRTAKTAKHVTQP